MKKTLFLILMVTAGTMAVAQDIKKVQTAYVINRFDDAKTEIDKVLADPKSLDKAETWFWKATVYASLVKDTTKLARNPALEQQANEAFKKYAEMDPEYALVKERSAQGFFDMYASSYYSGIKMFNNKQWETAASKFENAIHYIDIIIKNKWSGGSLTFDTTAVLYTAYAYQNAANEPKLDKATQAQRLAKAANFYGILADHKVSGKDYEDVYKFLVTEYTITKNEAQFNKYLSLGKELYPDGPWDEYEIDYMDKNYDLARKTEVYDKEDAAGTLSEIKYLQFGDLFVKVKNEDKELDAAKQKSYTLKAADAFKKAYGKNAKNGIAAFNVGVIYYNIYSDYEDNYLTNIRSMQAFSADRPVEKDPKKKAAADAKLKEQVDPLKKANAEIEKPMMENLDMAIEWLEKTYTVLKDKTDRENIEKSVLNKSVDFLANLYAYKRDRARGKDTQAFDAYDAKYKQFDQLHNKF